MTSPLLTAAEVAEILQTSERHVQRLAALEVRPLPSLDIGTGGKAILRFRRHELEAWLDSRREGAPPPSAPLPRPALQPVEFARAGARSSKDAPKGRR